MLNPSLPRLQVSENRRFLVREDGMPFFYLADTAWELFHRLNREEAVRYLDHRAAQGFTAIQAVALAELDGVKSPNAYGRHPLRDNDPLQPDLSPGPPDPSDPARYDYWAHVDFIVDAMLERGLYPALLPTWGCHTDDGTVDAGNARQYGEFLGQRYADRPLIWVIGGDRKADGYEEVWRALARGIAIGVAGREEYDAVLMTFHPRGGGTSSTWFHQDPWLDFNMQQNGHGANTPVWERIGADYARQPTKPVLDGEPLYEDHPIGFNAPKNGYSNPYEVRKFLYWDLFAGACGHTYGHHSVWQMFAPGRSPINGPLMSWYEAIHRPAAAQMRHARALLESRPFLTRIPDQAVLASDPGTGTWRAQATRDSEGSYLMVYTAAGHPVTVRLDCLGGDTACAWWYDPRTGEATEIGTAPARGEREYVPPTLGADADWVLVVDDAARDFPPPGSPFH